MGDESAPRGTSASGADPSPSNTLSKTDTGDEIGRRFRYQYTYAAILACALFTDDDEIVEVFCEHHEDVLLKFRDGQFGGVQVKTRQLGSEPWKSTDDDIVSALAKFIRLDCSFPGQFVRFTLATNHQFYTAKKNGRNLPYLLELASATSDGDATQAPLRKYVQRLARTSASPDGGVLTTLKKTRCDHSLPKIRDIVTVLCDHIRTHHIPCSEASFQQLLRAAEALAQEAERAATLYHEHLLPLYLSATTRTAADQTTARIEGKRFTPERVRRVVDDALQVPPSMLATAEASAPLPVPTLHSTLASKLDAGGLSAATLHAARDCWASALNQQLYWSSKLGEERALERYRHLKALALNEAAAAYETTRGSREPFGHAMLEDVRRRFRERRSRSPADCFDSLEEHLLGYAFILTEECKVWWSEPFALPAQSS